MRLPSGVTVLTGKKPGKTVAILAGVHGNERCGLLAFQELIPKLSLESGRVFFILGNLRAITKKVRFIDINLNRVFSHKNKRGNKGYEYTRVKEIRPLLLQSEALLDIHSSASKKSTPFIITEKDGFYVAKKMPFSIISYGWTKIEPGSSDHFMHTQGKIGICVECGSNNDPRSKKRAKLAITSFLASYGLIKARYKKSLLKKRIIFANYIYKTKKNFNPRKDFSDFASIKKGEFIGTDGNKKIFSPQTGVIVFSRKRKGQNEEAFILGK